MQILVMVFIALRLTVRDKVYASGRGISTIHLINKLVT